MADVTITINQASLAAGGALARKYTGTTDQAVPAAAIPKIIVTVGKTSDYAAGGAAIPIKYEGQVSSEPAWVVGALNITVGTAVFATDVQVKRMGQWFKNALADLVNKGIITVKIGGVTQTAIQIIEMSTS